MPTPTQRRGPTFSFSQTAASATVNSGEAKPIAVQSVSGRCTRAEENIRLLPASSRLRAGLQPGRLRPPGQPSRDQPEEQRGGEQAEEEARPHQLRHGEMRRQQLQHACPCRRRRPARRAAARRRRAGRSSARRGYRLMPAASPRPGASPTRAAKPRIARGGEFRPAAVSAPRLRGARGPSHRRPRHARRNTASPVSRLGHAEAEIRRARLAQRPAAAAGGGPREGAHPWPAAAARRRARRGGFQPAQPARPPARGAGGRGRPAGGAAARPGAGRLGALGLAADRAGPGGEVQPMRLADDGILGDAHAAADLGRRMALRPEGTELVDRFSRPVHVVLPTPDPPDVVTH